MKIAEKEIPPNSRNLINISFFKKLKLTIISNTTLQPNFNNFNKIILKKIFKKNISISEKMIDLDPKIADNIRKILTWYFGVLKTQTVISLKLKYFKLPIHPI